MTISIIELVLFAAAIAIYVFGARDLRKMRNAKALELAEAKEQITAYQMAKDNLEQRYLLDRHKPNVMLKFPAQVY